MGAGRPTRALARGVRSESQASQALTYRSLPVPPHRSEGAAGGFDRGAGTAAEGRQDPPRGRVEFRRRGARPRAKFDTPTWRILPSFCRDRKSTRLNSSHQIISYAVFCLKKKTKK